MPAKDGLLVRVRVTAGRLSAGTLRALAEAGRETGNGLFDLTSRANLQMRGIAPDRLPRLREILRALGLLDATRFGEAVRNVQISPLSGLEGPDLGPIAEALERALVGDETLHALPAKFGFLIDDARTLSLAGIPADIRFTRTAPGEPGVFAIGLGGRDDSAAFVGYCTSGEIVPTAVRLAKAYLELAAQLPESASRMSNLLCVVEPEAIAAAAGLAFEPSRILPGTPVGEPCPIGPLRLGTGDFCSGIGAAFGRLDWSMLAAAADAAESFGGGEIRLTPWRALLFPKVAPNRDARLRAFLSERGFITDPADARLAVVACSGVSACASATTDTRADASSLAGLARRLVSTGIGLHVSGCAKGCARSAATPCVLVARDGRYDLILEGTARSTPSVRGLTSAQASGMLEILFRERLVSP
jgi:precorrin-3B synthase